MKIFYRDQLQKLEERNRNLEKELERYRPKAKQNRIPLNLEEPKVPTLVEAISQEETKEFVKEDKNEDATDIAMRCRIRKMRDNERLDAAHSKRSYRIQNNRVVSLGFSN